MSGAGGPGEPTGAGTSLLAANEQLRLHSAALNSTANGVIITDRAGTIIWVNPAFTAVTGYEAAEAIGRTPRLWHSGRHDRPKYEELWRTILAGQKWRGEFVNRRRDGTAFHCETTITPVAGSCGAITHFVGVMTDVTQRKAEEDERRIAHARLRQLLEHSPVITYLLKVDGDRVVPRLVSDNLPRFLGFAVAEATSYEWWHTHLHPEDRERAIASVAETVAHDASTTEYRMRHQDGTYRWVSDARRVVRDAAGRPVELVGAWTDITERKRAEDILRCESREVAGRVRKTVGWEIAAIVGVTALAGGFLVATDAWGTSVGRFVETHHLVDEILGTGMAVLVGLGWFSFRRWRELTRHLSLERNIQAALRTLHAELETRVQQRTDELARANAGLRAEMDQRARTEAARRESDERFRHIAETIEEVFWMADADITEIVYISPAYERVWGRSCQSLYENPRSFMDAIVPEDRQRIMDELSGRPLTGSFAQEYRIAQPNGEVRWIWDRGFPVRNAEGVTTHFVGVAEDITERRLAERRMQLQHAVTAVLAESTTIAEANRKFLVALGETLRWDLGELWLVDRGANALRCAVTWESSARFRSFARPPMARTREEGLPARVWISSQPVVVPSVAEDAGCLRREAATAMGLRAWIGFPVKLRQETIGVVGFFSGRPLHSDQAKLSMLSAFGVQLGQFIERHQLAEQFRQAQKMEAIGTLAGGIAHDFNNIIAAISGYSELARMEARGNPAQQENLDAVLKASTRAAALVRQIVAFSRQQQSERSPIQLRHVVNEALSLLRATIPVTIDFDVSLGRDLPTVLADANQVHQVVMNLCTNAVQAMGSARGTLAVQLESCTVDQHLAELHAELRPGPYVRLTVSDTGKGMDAATMARIFEPFFTTKGPGEGTGLGLAVVHGIVQSHQGAVTVYSQPGEGAVFRVYFPATAEMASEPAAVGAEPPRGCGERILFVEDERPLAFMGQKILQRLGYRVEIHLNPADAIAAVRAAPDHFDLVITDFAMPGMTGLDLARELLLLRPGLPILLMTGHAPHLASGDFHSLGVQELLLKPLSLAALAQAVRRALHQVVSR